MKNSTLLNTTLSLTLAMLISGCVVTPVPYHYQQRATLVYPDYAPPTVIAYAAPPPPQTEVIGVPPAPGHFWISGVWLWEGGRHVWHQGHWAEPRPGFIWVPHRWHQEGREWHMDGGHWAHH